MAAFDKLTDLYSYFRSKALDLKCNPCFDKKQPEIEAMNQEGTEGKPRCLCKIGTFCPCEEAPEEIEQDGECYCGIFRRKQQWQ